MAPDDEVYSLGDFAFTGNFEKMADLIGRLNGRKYFILGNHCENKVWNKIKAARTTDSRLGSIAVVDRMYTKSFLIGEKKEMFVFCHFSLRVWWNQHYGSFHVFGHCVDLETEILTSEGFKKRSEIKKGDLLYTFNKTSGEMELDSVLDIFDYNYSGKVFHFVGNAINQRVTSQHRMIFKSPSNKIEETVAEDFSKKSVLKILNSMDCDTGSLDISTDLLRLYIVLVADGSIKSETDLCRVVVKKHRKIEYVRDILVRLGMSFTEYSHENKKCGTMYSINFYLPDELTSFNIKGLDTRIRKCNFEQVDAILEAYENTDGHRVKNSIVIYSEKEEEIDLLNEIFVLKGYRCKKYSRYHGFGNNLQYQLCVTKSNIWQLFNPKFKTKEDEVENEHFWCIKTRNGNFFSRRENVVSLTGNSHGSLVTEDRSMDVGIDAAYNVFGEHRFFTLEEVHDILSKKPIISGDYHDSEVN